MEKKKILFVDDDKNVLDGLRRLLYGMRDEWDMGFALSGREALALMERSHYDVIVSDMRMPEMDGAQLLTEVMRRYPFTARFVLSGQSDKETILKTVGPAHQYLSKPCDAEALKNLVSHALTLRNMLQNEEIRSLVSQIKTLPSIPSVYLRLQEELRKPDVPLSSVAHIVEADLGLSTKILQLVNSSFFGMPHKMTSITHAVSFLGVEILKALVFSVKVFESFGHGSKMAFSLEELMSQSFSVASCAKLIIEEHHKGPEFTETAFLSGALHDVGKLVLVAYFPKKFMLLQERASKTEMSSLALEKEIFGANHAEIGAYLLGLWGFKDAIVEAVAYHHNPGACANHDALFLPPLYASNLLYYETRGYDIAPALNAEKDFVTRTGLLEKLPGWRLRCAKILREEQPEQHGGHMHQKT